MFIVPLVQHESDGQGTMTNTKRFWMAIAMGVTIACAPAHAQQLMGDRKPFAIGKVAGQSLWLVRNCGGKISPEGDRAFKRAASQDDAEFGRGVREGHENQDAYSTISGKAGVCALLGDAFETAPLSRVWRR